MMVSTNNGGSYLLFPFGQVLRIFLVANLSRIYVTFNIQVIIWAKESIVLSQTDYQSKHEPSMYGWIDNGTHKWYSERITRRAFGIAKSKREEGHTTPKPIEIIDKGVK
jgi:hypothetical protein